MSSADPFEVRKADLLALRGRARTLDINQARRATGVLVGGRRSAFRGRGMDFEESRPYEPGDDVRAIDWRVTARRGEPHTKVYKPERERPVLILVDIGATMAFGSSGRLKSVLAAHVGALVTWMASTKGDRIGALIISDSQHAEIRPTTRPATVMRIFAALEKLQARPGLDPDLADHGALDEALARLAHAARPGTLVFVLSDFWRLGARGEHFLGQCARHCELVCGFVYDPIEQRLPGRDDYPFVYGDQRLLLHADDERTAQAYRTRFDTHRERLRTLCNRVRGHLIALSTSNDPVVALRKGLAGQDWEA